MGTTILSSLLAFKKLFERYFDIQSEVMSEEAKKIFSVDRDRKKYIDAIEYLKEHPETESKEIELSNKEKITLIS